MFIMAISIASDMGEILIPAIRGCPPIKTMFSQQELLLMWPKYEESPHQAYQSGEKYCLYIMMVLIEWHIVRRDIQLLLCYLDLRKQ